MKDLFSPYRPMSILKISEKYRKRSFNEIILLADEPVSGYPNKGFSNGFKPGIIGVYFFWFYCPQKKKMFFANKNLLGFFLIPMFTHAFH